ncbi:MAG: DUF6134 family protein [Dongiaceae bacterium]
MMQTMIAVNRLVPRLRCGVLAVLLLISLAAAGKAQAIDANDAPSGMFVYQVMRGNDVIGEQRLTFDRRGDGLTVVTDAKIDVKLLGMSLYGFDQHVEENWQNGQLVGFSSVADDDGTDKKTDMTLSGNQLTGTYNGKQRTAPLGIYPTSFWNADSVKQTQFIDTSRGKIRQVKVTDKGTEALNLPFGRVTAHHYSIDGDMKRELWYDEKGVLVAGELQAKDGSTIRQELLRAP